ncbi:MAG TPA: low affinity iron permease family protein [Burkholderiales bacterium]|nr:low affinity iron permease family protein [Burkholderiales bacterium]
MQQLRDIEPGEARTWRFGNTARSIATLVGRPAAFIIAALLIILWAASGPFFGFSDTWQLVVNTSTTIITFLMVFVIQNTQNRDTAAIQIKLDELIRATQGAHNAILDLEHLDEKQLQDYLRRYEQLATEARQRLEQGRLDTDSPDIKEPLRARSSRGA